MFIKNIFYVTVFLREEKNMEHISIRNMDLKYYVITYLFKEQENVYFIVSSSQKTAISYFILQARKNGLDINLEEIIKVNAIEIANSN